MLTAMLLSLMAGSFACSVNDARCTSPATAQGADPTLQFIAATPKQTPPVRTVYGAIMTEYLNVVDCEHLTVENVDQDHAEQGIFTTTSTLPVLTVRRVGCKPTETASTDKVDGEHTYPQVDWLEASGAIGELKKRSAETFSSAQANLLSMAKKLAAGIDPANDNITVKEFGFLRQINTALFTLDLIQAGFPLDETCDELHNSTMALNLAENLIDPQQAADIVCYAYLKGLYFVESFAEILSDLAAIEYAIQMSAYSSQTLQEVCASLDWSVAGYLGIDSDGIRQSVCKGIPGVSQTWPPMPSANTTSTTPTNSTTNMHRTSTTFDLGSATSAAGTVAPWFNTTTTTTQAVLTITATEATSSSSSHNTATPALADLPFFITPQARRAALRRHGRSVV